MSPDVSELKNEVCTADQLGLDPAGLEEIESIARSFVESGPLPSCQVAIGRYGRLGLFAAFGQANLRTRYATYSATKPITNSAIWILWGEGKVEPETLVVDVVPEFGTNGKDVITVEQVMCQTAGFPHAPLDFVTARDRQARLAKFAKWRLNWEPGTASEYHPTSAHWVLAEVIERVSGEDYREFIRRRITTPLGLKTIAVGVPPEEQGDIADLVAVGSGAGAYGETEATTEHMLNFNDPAVRQLGVPAAGCYGTTGDFALLYQAFLHDPYHLWKPEILADVTSRVRNPMWDRMSNAPANLSFGFHVNADAGETSGFGPTPSARTFGWSGAGGQEAWADAETGISFSFFTNGLDQDFSAAHDRARKLATIAACLAR
jgi:CubicO group peptidase (beta-lactamase class C family)